ncbi:MAG: ABC transporter ATP-binding protein [Promethearchaeota archaeon]
MAVNNVSFSIEKGDFVSIIGPSGSGKTTLLNLIGLLDTPNSGQIFLNGKDIFNEKKKNVLEIRRRTIGFIFQSFNLLPTMTALQNVEYPMIFIRMSKKERKKRAYDLLSLVGLHKRMNHLPTELSIGEQQRVAIARSLANNPELILADEPTGNLDTESGELVLRLMKALNEKEGKTYLIVTHDKDVASKTDYSIKMKDGRLVK